MMLLNREEKMGNQRKWKAKSNSYYYTGRYCVLDMPVSAIRAQISSAIDIIVHLARLRDKSRKEDNRLGKFDN